MNSLDHVQYGIDEVCEWIAYETVNTVQLSRYLQFDYQYHYDTDFGIP